MTRNQLIILAGPTAVGKTKVAIELALKLDTEIVSADSRQIYREMRIGTATPSAYELKTVPHHFIHSHSIHQYYNASKYEEEAVALINQLFKKNNTVIMVGGSGLYIDAVLNGIDELPTIDPSVRKKIKNQFEENGLNYIQNRLKQIDPEYYHKVDLNNYKRILKVLEVYEMTGTPYSKYLTKPKKQRNFRPIIIVLNTDREELYNRINQRVDQMIEDGLIEEARKLEPYKNLTPLNTVGYKELFEHFEGKLKRDEAIEQIKNHSRAYARRQITWFRRYNEARWFDPQDSDRIIEFLLKEINEKA